MATKKKLMMAAAGGASADYWRFNLDYASYNPPASLNGDVLTADPINDGSITGETTSVNDIQFNSIGTKMYLMDTNELIEFRTIDPPWYLPDLNLGVSDSITSGNNGFHLIEDESKMFAVEGGSVYEYTISGGTYTLAHTLDVSAQETDAAGIFVGDDGSKMYIGGVTSDNIYEYTLSTPYLLSSATYVQTFAAGGGDITSIRFRSDGLRMYAQKGVYDIHQYNLTSAWDISTASYIQEYSPTNTAVGVKGLWFSDDMSTMAIGCDGDNSVYRYSIGGFEVTNTAYGISFKPDGSKMFVGFTNASGDGVLEYSLSTAWDTSTAVLENTLTTAAGVDGIFFKPDGTKMFIVSGNDILEYALSDPWSLASSSASLTQTFDPAATSRGIYIKPSGDIMFVTGLESVRQYSLSTAWDVSSATLVKTLGNLGSSGDSNDIAFSPNGVRMFLTQDSQNGVRQVAQYRLSIPWDMEDATKVKEFDISTMALDASGLFFNDDGDKFFVTSRRRLFSYALSE